MTLYLKMLRRLLHGLTYSLDSNIVWEAATQYAKQAASTSLLTWTTERMREKGSKVLKPGSFIAVDSRQLG